LSLSFDYNELKKAIKLIDFELDLIEKKAQSYEDKKETSRIAILKIESGISDVDLYRFREVATILEYKIGLANEMEEAIAQGVILNKKFNTGLKYIETLIELSLDSKSKPYSYSNFRFDRLEKYQTIIIRIEFELLKFKKEYNDVHEHFFGNDSQSESHLENFLKEMRHNLMTDIRGKKGLKNSLKILTSFKTTIMSIVRTLRSDVRKFHKEILDLEKRELV